MTDKEYLKIDEAYLEELIDYCGRNSCGKILKRFEIIENREILKSETKELIYEGFRLLRDLIYAHNKGLDMSTFKFDRKESKKDKS